MEKWFINKAFKIKDIFIEETKDEDFCLFNFELDNNFDEDFFMSYDDVFEMFFDEVWENNFIEKNDILKKELENKNKDNAEKIKKILLNKQNNFEFLLSFDKEDFSSPIGTCTQKDILLTPFNKQYILEEFEPLIQYFLNGKLDNIELDKKYNDNDYEVNIIFYISHTNKTYKLFKKYEWGIQEFLKENTFIKIENTDDIGMKQKIIFRVANSTIMENIQNEDEYIINALSNEKQLKNFTNSVNLDEISHKRALRSIPFFVKKCKKDLKETTKLFLGFDLYGVSNIDYGQCVLRFYDVDDDTIMIPLNHPLFEYCVLENEIIE